MDASVVSAVLRDALSVVIRISMPILLLGMVVGVVVAIFQAVTQVHEQSLGFILKLLLIVVVLLVGGSWMLQLLQEYTREIFAFIAA